MRCYRQLVTLGTLINFLLLAYIMKIENLSLRQTFFMPGWVMEAYPATVEAILTGGYEIGHHSWRHEDPMGHSDAREAELFHRALEVHVRMTGRKPRGYRAPVYNATPAIMKCRMKKTAFEIEQIRRACLIGDKMLQAGRR